MPGRDPYPQLLGGGGPILRPRPLDGRPARNAPAGSGVVESGPPHAVEEQHPGQHQVVSKGGGGRRSAPGGRPPPALNIMSLWERPLAREGRVREKNALGFGVPDPRSR